MNSKRIKWLIAIPSIIIDFIIYWTVKGILVFDYSAVRRGEGVEWNGVFYEGCSAEYTEGKTIAKTKDGFNINEVVEDESHTFIVLRSFLDQYLLVREDYEIPTSGKINILFIKGEQIKDKEFIEAFTNILENKTSSFKYETDEEFEWNNNEQMKLVRVGYENCPIATSTVGYLGTVEGKWHFVEKNVKYDDYLYDELTHTTVTYYPIEEKYHKIIEKHWNTV